MLISESNEGFSVFAFYVSSRITLCGKWPCYLHFKDEETDTWRDQTTYSWPDSWWMDKQKWKLASCKSFTHNYCLILSFRNFLPNSLHVMLLWYTVVVWLLYIRLTMVIFGLTFRKLDCSSQRLFSKAIGSTFTKLCEQRRLCIDSLAQCFFLSSFNSSKIKRYSKITVRWQVWNTCLSYTNRSTLAEWASVIWMKILETTTMEHTSKKQHH